MTGNPNVYDLAAAQQFQFPALTYRYGPREVALYALGVGAGADPVNAADLPFVYELHGAGFKVLPTFAVLFSTPVFFDVLNLPGVRLNPMMLVHGEQELTLFGALPSEAVVTSQPRLAGMYDKGSGMVLVIDSESVDAQGQRLAVNRYSLFLRGLGGFGGDRGPAATPVTPPERPPDAVVTQATRPDQALLYRLSGDTNPLHADPSLAALGGYPRPILHGLCTLGFAARAVLAEMADNDPARVRGVRVRFSKHVFPGETLVTELWRTADDTVVFQTRTVERGEAVLSSAVVTLG